MGVCVTSDRKGSITGSFHDFLAYFVHSIDTFDTRPRSDALSSTSRRGSM